MASPLRSNISDKRCRKCGSDLLHRPRVKDNRGRYYCKPCYETALAAKREKAAAEQRSMRAAATTPSEESPAAEPEAIAEILPDEGDVSRYDALLDVESSAALPAPVTCPSCGRGLATDAVICTACGYDRRTGRRIGVSSAPPTEPQSPRAGRSIAARRSSSAAADGTPQFWQTGWFFGVASLAFFGLLFAGAQANAGLSIAFQAVQIIYSLVVTLWIIVLAFQEGVAQGLLSFLCGPYLLYFGFAKVESTHLKFGLGVSIIANVMGAMLGAQTLMRIVGQQAGAAS
jgi:uncharacterized Zn finger protein (UPF0148 family)